MRTLIRPAVVTFAVLTLLTGVVYPLLVTGISQLFFPQQANGSLIAVGEQTVGSELIAQGFTDPKYFWPRPSAANYDGSAGSGSNLGPSNPLLIEAVNARVAALRAADPGNNSPIPVDLITASGSGLDPHISVAAANYQMARVARVRHLSSSDVAALIDQHVEPRTLGVLGEPRVNVLKLNLAIDGHANNPSTAKVHDPAVGNRWPMTAH